MNDRTNKCFRIGQKAVDSFSFLARERGYKVVTATKEQDINEHWDLALLKASIRSTHDIKAMKKIQRHDNAVQDKWIWIELHSVRANNRGWLYDGLADFITFEMKDRFLIIPRLQLCNLVNMFVKKEQVYRPQDAKYKIYQRKERCDQLTLIDAQDLQLILFDEWKKYESQT